MTDEPVRGTPSWSHGGAKAPKRELPRNARPLSAQILPQQFLPTLERRRQLLLQHRNRDWEVAG
ncbi:hypothetical protein PC116_g2574 [Phytophthora cactorum]|uniref:Uncharacterized protein n=1 Tax=Phytophthora cactorum TaxID=29920 RepID=A0A8T1ECU1_9STRA|nr:hypothetical protein Pcac1_g10666 [Phytophthora cactorum]KAG2933835.1 hypothetical protein PC114_g1214 [Phytophthora cactorum]KAG2950278.1 hypothetical protein PC117_g4570 [Phytophthora cactorum]KAG3016574.1 hypothetical protein PC120_g11546 [Phytophthora cactorum]KAG3034798.1 hypothetical protein PC119_g4751 [Phytophthora cactorum]